MRKKYQLRSSDLIINTLIKVSEKENRRVIDTTDLFEFEGLLRKKCAEDGFLLEEQTLKDEENLKDYIYQQGEGLSKRYGLLPWVGISDLYDTRLSLPLCLCSIFSMNQLETRMKKRSREELESFKKLDLAVVNHVLSQAKKNEVSFTSRQKKNLALCKIYNRK